MKQKILFLCSHNSARSQMAEGFVKAVHRNKYEAFSAGIEKTNVNPYAVEVMKEIGIDLSEHYSKSIEEFSGQEFDFVVTVCDDAKEACPFFPGKKVIHKSFEDPAKFQGSVEKTLDNFRTVRDQIKDWIEEEFG